MRPLADIAPDTWRSVEGIASDLDDTLTHHGTLVPAALEALYALDRAGVPCVVATGRSLGWAEVLARLLPVRAVVAENGGAWVLREAKALRAAFVHDDATRAEGMQRVTAMVTELCERFPALRPVTDLTARVTDVAIDIGESVQVERAVVLEAMERVRSAGLHAVASSVHLHVSARAPDKTEGLRAALASLDLDPDALATRWVYVGDSPNDAGPFAAMELSVGVAGVSRFVGAMPALPRYICEGDAGEGFAEVVRALLSAVHPR